MSDSGQRLSRLVIVEIVDACVCHSHGAIFHVKVTGDSEGLLWVDESVMINRGAGKLLADFLSALQPAACASVTASSSTGRAKRKDIPSPHSMSPRHQRKKVEDEAKHEEKADEFPRPPLVRLPMQFWMLLPPQISLPFWF